MTYYDTSTGEIRNEELRARFRKELKVKGSKPWNSDILSQVSETPYQWCIEKGRHSGYEYYLPFRLQLGRCPFPQFLLFHTKRCDVIRVSYFHIKEKTDHYGQYGMDRSFSPFTLENTTPYQLSRIAEAIQWACHGGFGTSLETGGFPWSPETNIYIGPSRYSDKTMAIIMSDGSSNRKERELWDYEFFPPSGVEVIMKLIAEIRSFSMNWFW